MALGVSVESGRTEPALSGAAVRLSTPRVSNGEHRKRCSDHEADGCVVGPFADIVGGRCWLGRLRLVGTR